MSTSIADILRRRRREPLDERLPDGIDAQNLLNQANANPQVPTPQSQQTITRPRQVAPPASPEWERTYEGARKSASTPIPPELADIAIGEDYSKDRPGLYRINQQGGSVSIQPLDTQREAGGITERLRSQGRPFPASDFPTQEIPAPLSVTAEPELRRERAVTFDPQTGRPNEDYYRERGDTAGLYEATRNWEPHGGKRGFKNSLKAALMMGAEGARANPNDPVTGALAGLALGGAAGTAVPNLTNRLRRQQKLSQLGGELKQNLELKKQQAAIDQSQMVEVELDNGQRVMVPAKSAATLQSRQQEIGLRGDTLQARKKRWNQLGEHEAARDAQALYNSGAADDSAELRAEIARRLRLPAGTVLPPRGLGNQIKLDESGNYVIISPRSGEVTQTNQKSYEPVREAGRDRRATQAQQAAMARVQAQQAGANQRAGMRGSGPTRLDSATRNNIAKGVGAVETVKGELTQIDAQIKALDDATKGRALTPEEQSRITSLGRQRQEKVNEARAIAAHLDTLDPDNETGVGEGGYPYRKPREGAQRTQGGKYAGRRISQANVAEYGKRHGMTTEQARDYLASEGAIIY